MNGNLTIFEVFFVHAKQRRVMSNEQYHRLEVLSYQPFPCNESDLNFINMN